MRLTITDQRTQTSGKMSFQRFILAVSALLFLNIFLHAQATLSVQGILKKSNGVALEDGTYSIKFNIYAVDGTPAGILWDEVNPAVELNGGIYSVVLGEIEPLSLGFDQDYELGVQIGSQEMTPRIRLTSAPYALALRGSSNQFPSAGQVLADEIKVADGVIASGGAPGLNNANKNGYTFHNGGDNDGGLFSTADGEVSVYVNSTEKMEVKDAKTTFSHPVEAPSVGVNGVNLYNNGTINYSTTNGGSFSAWRLADVDDFGDGSTHGWASYAPVSGEWIGWNQVSANGTINNVNFGTFAGNVITPSVNNQILKKQFTVPGGFSQVKVKFRYYIIDSWDNGFGDMAIAGFSGDVGGSNFKVAWYSHPPIYLNANGRLNTDAIRPVLNFQRKEAGQIIG
ncbi:MAG: hypothetical protein IPN29_05610 [Saprospiraceae bacterium]|nr:hypothetical protein [Saprospiraceae bacterium]